ncbi:MAG: glycosyltransferase family 2 protein [Candidatus Roizmanbacteria bacterium]
MKWFYSSRFAEIIVTLLTWITLTTPLWLSPFHPAVVAYGIIAFNIYFFFQSVKTTVNSIKSFVLLTKHSHIDYRAKVLALPVADYEKIHHFVIIPCFKESVGKLTETIDSIINGDYPHLHNVTIVLGFEKRELEAPHKAQQLQDAYRGKVTIIVTYHELTSVEIPGKASNQTWAAKEISRICQGHGYDPHFVICTIGDADSNFPANYFSYLTYEFLRDTDRYYHFYWAPVLLYNNFWELSFFVRMQASLSSIVRLAHLQEKEKLIQISTYSVNLKLIQDIGYWDVDIIPEDWHIHLQAFFTYGDRIRTIPLYTIVNGDAVNSGNMYRSLLSRYEQEKRWAWGVSDIAYAWKRSFETPHIPVMKKVSKILFILKIHLLWPTSFFILTVFATITPLINPLFKRSVMGFILPQVSGIILTTASSMLIIYTILDIKIRQRLNIQTKPLNFIFLALQWYILPFVSFFLSALPALDAHTRMLLGKKLVYKVTEKK